MEEPFSEAAVFDAINGPIRKNQEIISEPGYDILAELMAFGFCENYPDRNTGWGTYYGPMLVLKNKQGQFEESPSIQMVTKDMLDYWLKRSKEAKHPLLRLRYADLVLDFSNIVIGHRSELETYYTVIDQSLIIADKRLSEFDVDIIAKLERALSLALSINDRRRIEAVRDSIIAFEDKIADDNKPGLWGFAFRLLVENKKVPLNEAIRTKIITDLESRLLRLTDPNNPENIYPNAAESVAVTLANYYRKNNNIPEFHKVLKQYGDFCVKQAENAYPLVGQAFLMKLYEIYREYGMKTEADALNMQLQDVGQKVITNMKRISHEVKISNEDIENYLSAMTEGSLEQILSKIAIQYIPDKSRTIKQVEDLSKRTVMLSHISRVLLDHEGRPVAHIGPLESDPDGHLIQQISQNMKISSMLLHLIIDKLKQNIINVDNLLAFIYQSPLYDDKKKQIFTAGLDTYLKGNYLVAIHILTPQIEELIRTLVRLTSGPIYKPSRHGGLMLKNFEDLLADDRVRAILGEDVTLYLRTLYSDQRGWNIRNSLCHGIMPIGSFDSAVADRILHTLLLFALIRYEETQKNESGNSVISS